MFVFIIIIIIIIVIIIRKHINILERNRRGEVRKKGKYLEVAQKYKMKEKGQNVVTEELKQRLQAKAAKLKRYE